MEASDHGEFMNASGTGIDVALSFAGEQRPYVERVAASLRAKGIRVFYDQYETVAMWGHDGHEFLQRVYRDEARFTVMFISADYVRKAWPTHERRAALDRELTSEEPSVLPVRFDDTPVPGLSGSRFYLDAREITPEQLAHRTCERLSIDVRLLKATAVPPPSTPAYEGEVTFDYSAHDGVHVLGQDECAFETKWTKGGRGMLYLYNDPVGIRGIALAVGAHRLSDVSDAGALDFTSRHREVRAGEIAVLQNVNGFHAAVELVEAKARGHGDAVDTATIRYAILRDHGGNFSILARNAPAAVRSDYGDAAPADIAVARPREPGEAVIAVDLARWEWARGVEFGGACTVLYGEVLHNAPPYQDTANVVEYRFEVAEGGAFDLEAEYAAAASRPVSIAINSKVVASAGLASVTGGWEERFQVWELQTPVILVTGENTLRLARANWFPHIRRIAFTRRPTGSPAPLRSLG